MPISSHPRLARQRRLAGRAATRRAGALVLAALGAAAALALPASAQEHVHGASMPVTTTISSNLVFTVLDDPADVTFNQLLGINDLGTIAGYYGSGATATHPNKGYTLGAYTKQLFSPENYPGSAQTQVTGLNDMGKTVGFYVDAAGDNLGFWNKNGHFASFSAPGAAGKTKTTQLLGVNNEGLSVGFYNDAAGNAHAFEYNTKTGAFRPIVLPGATSTTATGVNDDGDVVGFYTTANKVTEGFLLKGGVREVLNVPGASATQPFGLNDLGEVVGQYSAGKATHGFVEQGGHFVTVDDPAGVGTTTVNGVNNLGDLVGFYTDKAGNTDGFVAQPQFMRTGA